MQNIFVETMGWSYGLGLSSAKICYLQVQKVWMSTPNEKKKICQNLYALNEWPIIYLLACLAFLE